MRIAILLTTLGVGGAERQAVQVAERLASRGHAVRIFSLLSRQPEEWETHLPVTYLDMGKGLWSLPAAWLRAAWALRDFKPDVVHGHCFHGNIFARLLRPALRGARILSTVHNIFEGGRARMLVYRATNRLSDVTVFVCRAGAERYRRLHAVTASRSKVLPNGIDTAAFTPDPERRVQMRAGLPRADCFLWIAVGRLAPAKDYPTLLRAFAQLRAAFPAAQLWVAGQGSDKAFAEHALLATELRLSGSVQWLGLRRDVPALLDAADAFILSSAWEGMPLVVGEAMAMQKPIVATDVGGVSELTGPRIHLVDAGNRAALADAMMETMNSPPSLRAEEGCAARARIERHFSLEGAADRWENLYHELAPEAELAPR